MEMSALLFLVVCTLFFGQFMGSAWCFQRTTPAFLWSPHLHFHLHGSGEGLKQSVEYHTFTPKDLAKAVLSNGRWSNLLCPGRGQVEHVDVVLVFIGHELQTSEISRKKQQDPLLRQLLEASFSKSNFSIAYPFVAASVNDEPLESCLVNEFIEYCGGALQMNDFMLLGSCSIGDDDFLNIAVDRSFTDFVEATKNARSKGHSDVVIFCNSRSYYSEDGSYEGKLLSDFITKMDKSGMTYAVLYASDPRLALKSSSHGTVERFLAENIAGNSSVNVTCDGICQIKSSLLEGVFVGGVLLVILLSGLWFMISIDTPTRFEAPQDNS